MRIDGRRFLLVLGLFFFSAGMPRLARAGSLSGTIHGAGGAPLPGMEVRLWSEDPKGWKISTTVQSDASGAYAFTGVPAGRYLLDARMPAGYTGNYGDRWYDVVDPTGDGYIGEDADVIEIADTDALTGYDLTLEILGGLDGRVLNESGTPFTGALIRAEWKTDFRFNHNDQTAGPGPHWGQFFMRGLPPHPDYRFILYDPSGYEATQVVPGPFTVTTGVNAGVGDLSFAPLPPDPLEPNDGPGDSGGERRPPPGRRDHSHRRRGDGAPEPLARSDRVVLDRGRRDEARRG